MDPLTLAPWRFPTAQPCRLANGLTARFVHMPGRLVATVAAVLDLPTEVETPRTEGVVAAWSSLVALDEALTGASGTGAAARLGAQVTTGSDHRGPKLIADCAADDLPALLGVLAPALLDPHPSPEAFALLRRRRTAELDLERHDPFALANKLFNESVLDPANRYARPVTGTARSWDALRLTDVTALHAAHVDPAHLTLTVVGDLRGVPLAAAVERAFGAYPSTGRPAVADRPPRPGGPPALTLRPGREDAQTQLLLGCFSVDRRDPRWPTARVLADVLGGAGGLVNRRVRGDLGLSYGLDVRFLPYVRGGTFAVSGKVDARGAAAGVQAVLDVLRGVRDGDLDAGAVVQARDRLVDSAPQVFESTLGVAQQYAELDSCGLDPSYIDAHLQQLRELGVDRFRREAATLVDPDTLHAVVVGDCDVDATALAGRPRR